MSITSLLIKYMFNKGDKKRDEGLLTPEDITRHNDISYGKYKKWNLLDIYYPKNTKGKLPTIINVHGGGWVYGNKEVYQFYCMSLAQKGFTVVNLNYRLAPAHKFPSSIEDLNQVVHWVLQNHRDYPIDLSRIYMVGDSAGAHMTTLYCCLCTNPEFAARFSFRVPEKFVPKAVALNCGVYDMQVALEQNFMRMQDLIKDLMGKRRYETDRDPLNAIAYVNQCFPPAYVMTSNKDFLNYQAPILVKKLEELKVPHVFKEYGDEKEGLDHVFHCNIRLEQANICNAEECKFFLSLL